MENRYIRRFALPERMYTASAPVVLAAGVVLEDTRIPRLVAQLKWKSIDEKPLTALTVSVQCPQGNGGSGQTLFTYSDLHITRGQTFGVYTAIVLPQGSAPRMDVRVLSAAFADGTVWTAPEDAVWAPLPAFTSLRETVADPKLLALSAALPKNRYAFWSGQGLWYCSCGAVNHDREAMCHRCGCRREDAASLATADGLQLVQRRRTEEAARLAQEEVLRRAEARARMDARKEAARQQLSQWKARFRRDEVPGAAPAEQPEPPLRQADAAPSAPQVEESGTPAPERQPGTPPESAPIPAPAEKAAVSRVSRPRKVRKKALGIAAAVVLLAVVGIFVLPRVLGGSGVSLPGSAPDLHVTAPGDGETMTFSVQEDEDGVCRVTQELVQKTFPSVAYINLDGVPNMGNDIDDYLINSFQMSMLVTSHGEIGSEGEWGSFNANDDPNSPLCLLLFDENTHLMGHAVGVPKKAGGGVWQLEVTLCDYDFTSLYEEQLAAFTAQREETFAHYIAPEDIADSGAKYFLTGYNTGRGPTLLPGDSQAYHLWAQYTSGYVEQHCREMDRLMNRLPRDDRWRCFLFLDEDYQLLGYTMMDSTGQGGQAADTDIVPLGTVDLIVQEDSSGNCEFTEAQLRQLVPEMDFFNFGGYMPDLGGDVKAYVKDSLHMAWLVTSQGQEQGGHSSATWNLSEDHIFTLLLYRDFTTLCGYFVGAPEKLGNGQWRMEITLCDYDFTALYEEQSTGYEAAPQLPEISQEDIASCGAAWYIEPVDQFYEQNSFYQRLKLQSLWSRVISPYISRFCAPITDLPNSARWAAPERPRTYLLLNDNMQSLGYVTITDGERIAALDLTASNHSASPDTVSLDLTADGEYCTLTLEQVQQVVPQAQFMEFRGMPDLGSIEEFLKVSDQMTWLVASDGTRSMKQSSGRFSVQNGRIPFRVLLLYSGPTTLCSYFIGQPTPVGGDTWRMEITLYDYDFSSLYEQQTRDFARASLPQYIAPEQVETSGAVWCIDSFYLTDNDAFSQAVQHYGMWSREQSVGKERFCKSIDDLQELQPQGGGKTTWAYLLLLDKNYRTVGYTILTN